MYNTCRRIPETIGFTGYFLYFVVSLNHQVSGEKPVPRDAKDIQFAELKDMIAQLNTTIAALTGTIQEKDAAIAKLTEEVSYLRRKPFGASSEKRPGIDPNQLSLFDTDEGMEIPVADVEEIPGTVVREHTRQRKKKPTLEEQFKGAAINRVVVGSLTDEEKKCPVCGAGMVPIGTEVIRREVEFIPARYEVTEYVATTYECPKCKQTEEPQFIKDEGCPPALIEKSYATPSLVSGILKNKFVLGLPFYRQEQDLKRSGILITRATMAAWAILVFQLYFQFLVQFFHRELLKRHFLMMDGTPVQVPKEPGKRPQSKSYVWLMRSGEDGLPPLLIYRYSPTRNGNNAVEMLESPTPGLYLMVDGFQGYDKLKNVKRCACYAHIRRYFLDAIPKGSEKDLSNPAVQGVAYCDKLFRYERIYKEQGLSHEQRQKRRMKDEKPVVDAFIKWLDQQKMSASSNKFNKALTYARNRQDILLTYLEDGRCSLSDNMGGNSVRPVVVGRKNWLFSDTVGGAEASMGIYTIVEMAKFHGLDPYKYMKYILEQRPSYRSTDEELEKLAPWSSSCQEICK